MGTSNLPKFIAKWQWRRESELSLIWFLTWSNPRKSHRRRHLPDRRRSQATTESNVTTSETTTTSDTKESLIKNVPTVARTRSNNLALSASPSSLVSTSAKERICAICPIKIVALSTSGSSNLTTPTTTSNASWTRKSESPTQTLSTPPPSQGEMSSEDSHTEHWRRYRYRYRSSE